MERRWATFWVWPAVRIPPGHIRCSHCHGPVKGLIVGWEGACSFSKAGWRRGRGCRGMSDIILCQGPRPNTHLLILLAEPCMLLAQGELRLSVPCLVLHIPVIFWLTRSFEFQGCVIWWWMCHHFHCLLYLLTNCLY